MEYQKRPQDGISREQKLTAAKKYFWCALWSIGKTWVFMEEELGLEGPTSFGVPPGCQDWIFGILISQKTAFVLTSPRITVS